MGGIRYDDSRLYHCDPGRRLHRCEPDAPHRPEWIGYSDRAKALVIGNGVTKPGAYAFYKFTALETVSIPDSVTELREYALGLQGDPTSPS